MKRSWNPWLWWGFAVALAGVVSYVFLLEYPVTRDFPWVNLLLFAIAAALLVAGLFCYALFGLMRDLPASAGAPRAGTRAPEFSLTDTSGRRVTLADLQRGNRAALLIFYRGYW